MTLPEDTRFQILAAIESALAGKRKTLTLHPNLTHLKNNTTLHYLELEEYDLAPLHEHRKTLEIPDIIHRVAQCHKPSSREYYSE